MEQRIYQSLLVFLVILIFLNLFASIVRMIQIGHPGKELWPTYGEHLLAEARSLDILELPRVAPV